MFKTHLAFGILVGLAVTEFFDISDKWLFMAHVTGSAILADLDIPVSKIGGIFKPLSWLLNILFGHRGFMHTIFFPLIIYILLTLLDKHFWAGAFFLGYMSHLVADMMNLKGIYFFYPISHVKMNGFIRTGGILEYFLFILMIAGVIFLLI